MRLITHNMLQCHRKGCEINNFPLKLEQVQLEQEEADFNREFLLHFIPKLDWAALTVTATSVFIDSHLTNCLARHNFLTRDPTRRFKR